MHWHRFVAAVAILACCPAAAADTLYAASVRSLEPTTSPIVGNLYQVDPKTGAHSLVAPIRVDGKSPIGVTGLAIHPQTRIIYGITAASSPSYPATLVTIDRTDGDATLVGALGAVGSDIAFDARGQLFAWLPATRQIAKVDLERGKATAIGTVGRAVTTGGLAIDPQGRILLAGTGATGTLDTLDGASGDVVASVALHGAPYPAGINSLTVAPDGAVFAVNTNLGAPAQTVLLKVDVATGAMVPVRALPDDTDALVFAPSPSLLDALPLSLPALAIIAALILGGSALAGYLLSRGRR